MIKSIDYFARFCYPDINICMNTQWADIPEDFFESLHNLKDLVDVNYWKLEYVNFAVLEVCLFSASMCLFRGGLTVLNKALQKTV